MSQQTAVEWLVKELKLEGYDYTVEQAKQMGKEQITKAYNDGYRDGLPSTSKEGIDISEYDNARLYYKEIYG